jgi:hypothetical protein
MNRALPLVEYAQKIGKNTAELTTSDMVNFTREWMKQQPRKDILAMAKSYTTKKFQDAHTSRLAEQGIESPINDGVEEIIIHNDEVVCEMGLTKMDVEALKFAIQRCFADYELEGHEHGVCLKSLLEALEGV